MANYVHDVIHVDTGEIVALKFIESFLFDNSEEGRVVSKLKDDVTIRVRTISGTEYTASALNAYKKIHNIPEPSGSPRSGAGVEIAESIYERWIWQLKP